MGCNCCGFSVVCKWFKGRRAEELPTRIEDQNLLTRWLRANARMGSNDDPIAPVPVPANTPPRCPDAPRPAAAVLPGSRRPAAAVLPTVPVAGPPTTGTPVPVIPEAGEPDSLEMELGLFDEDEDQLIRIVAELSSEMLLLSFESDAEEEEAAEEQAPAGEADNGVVVAVDEFEEDNDEEEIAEVDEEEAPAVEVVVVDETTTDLQIYHLNSGAGRFFLDLIRTGLAMALETPPDRVRRFLERNSNVLRHLVTGTVPNPRHYVHDEDTDEVHETRMTPAGVAEARRLILNISSLDWGSERIEGVLDDLCDDGHGTGIRVKEFLRKHFRGQRSPKAIVFLRRTNENFRNDDDLFKYMKKVAQRNRGKSKLSQELARVTEISDSESDNGEGCSKPA